VLRHAVIRANGGMGGRASIMLDGKDVSAEVVAYQLVHPGGRPPALVVEVAPDSVVFDGEAEVSVSSPAKLIHAWLDSLDRARLEDDAISHGQAGLGHADAFIAAMRQQADG
jgi:hypothetical protein